MLWNKRKKLFQQMYYSSKTLNNSQQNYTFIEQELLQVVYAF